MSFSYYIIYKPFGVLSQFSGEGKTLGSLGDFPSDVYPVGRLDKDSEGLLILTNDKRLNHLLLDPTYLHERTYWVQVEGEITAQAILSLEQGVMISVNKKPHKTLKAKAKTLRLVRWSVENLTIEGFETGEVRSFDQDTIYSSLGISTKTQPENPFKSTKIKKTKKKKRF